MKSFALESESYPESLRQVRLFRPVLAQVILYIFAALMLDGGWCLCLLTFGVILYWIFVIIVAIRRRDSLTKGDVVLIRYGYVIFAAAGLIGVLLVAWSWNMLHP